MSGSKTPIRCGSVTSTPPSRKRSREVSVDRTSSVSGARRILMLDDLTLEKETQITPPLRKSPLSLREMERSLIMKIWKKNRNIESGNDNCINQNGEIHEIGRRSITNGKDCIGPSRIFGNGNHKQISTRAHIQIRSTTCRNQAYGILERLVTSCRKRELVRSVSVFKGRSQLNRILSMFASAQQGRGGPNLRIAAIHFEDAPTDTRGHFHIIHDCNRNRGSCRCAFLRGESYLRFAKGIVWRHQWDFNAALGELLHLSSDGRHITHMFTQNRREAIPDRDTLLEIRRCQQSEREGEISSHLCNSESSVGCRQPSSFINSSDIHSSSAGSDILPPSSALKYVRKTTVYVLKIEAVCSSEMLVSTYKSTRRRNPEDQYRLLFQIWIFVPELGSPCDSQANCSYIADSTCQNSTCSCAQGFVRDQGNTSCLPVASDLGSVCKESVQCSTKLGALVGCVENKCMCVKEAVEFDGHCRKKKNLKDNCEIKEECRVSNSECIEKECRCAKGYSADDDGQECTPSSGKDVDVDVSSSDGNSPEQEKADSVDANNTEPETSKTADDSVEATGNRTQTGKMGKLNDTTGSGVNTTISLSCLIGTWIGHLVVLKLFEIN